MFDFQKLNVYQKSLSFIGLTSEILSNKSIRSHLADQLDRASTSITLNISEGAGEFKRKEKSRFYRMARRSSTESVGVLDILKEKEHISPSAYQTGQTLLFEIVKMLTRLSLNLENSCQ